MSRLRKLTNNNKKSLSIIYTSVYEAQDMQIHNFLLIINWHGMKFLCILIWNAVINPVRCCKHMWEFGMTNDMIIFWWKDMTGLIILRWKQKILFNMFELWNYLIFQGMMRFFFRFCQQERGALKIFFKFSMYIWK